MLYHLWHEDLEDVQVGDAERQLQHAVEDLNRTVEHIALYNSMHSMLFRNGMLRQFRQTHPEYTIEKRKDPKAHFELDASAELVGEDGGDGEPHGAGRPLLPLEDHPGAVSWPRSRGTLRLWCRTTQPNTRF